MAFKSDGSEFEKLLLKQAGMQQNEKGEYVVPEEAEASAPGAKAVRKVKRDQKILEAAFGFVGLCNNFQSQQPTIMSPMGETSIEIPDIDPIPLPPAQNIAFNYACKLIAEIFRENCAIPEVHPEMREDYDIGSMHAADTDPEPDDED